MINAAEMDRIAYARKQPAVNKLLLSKRLYEDLKKINIRDKFLSKGGCDNLAEWLDHMEDGTFPNINLTRGLLDCIDGLDVNADQIRDSTLIKVLNLYMDEKEKGVAPEIRKLVIIIRDKWDRTMQRKSSYKQDEA